MNIETKLRALFIANPPEELGPSDDSQYRDGYNTALEDAIEALAVAAPPAPSVADAAGAMPTGWRLVPFDPTDEMIDAGCDIEPVTRWGSNGEILRLRYREMVLAAPPAPSVADADFKNFHRLLCERFGYEHDEQHWKRDQLSLIEHLAWGRCTTPSQEERRSESIDCGECACLPGFCDKEGEIRSVLRLIVNKIDEEGPASRDWKGFNQLCELAKELLESAPSVADAAGAKVGEISDAQLQDLYDRAQVEEFDGWKDSASVYFAKELK